MKSLKKRRIDILKIIERATRPVIFQEHYLNGVSGSEERKAPNWSLEDVYEIEQLAKRGLVKISKTVGDEPWLNSHEPEGTFKETYIHLMPQGHDFLEDIAHGWWRKQFQALGKNVITIVVSVIIAVLSALMLNYTGLDQMRPEK